MRNLDFPHSLFLDRANLSRRLDRDSPELAAIDQVEKRQELMSDLTDQLMTQMVDIEVIIPTEA